MTQHANHNQSHHDDCLFSVDHLYEAALGILEPADRARLEHHLAECDVCRAELAELDATVNLLPLAVEPVEPRAEVKDRLMSRLQSEIDAPSPAAPARARARKKTPAPNPSMHRSMWAFGSVFAGLFVALLAIAVWNFLPMSDDGNAPQGQLRVLAMENPGCEDCHEDTRGHIGANLEATDGMVVAYNLDPDQKHEVWCVNRDGYRFMVGELKVDEHGAAMQTMTFPEEVGGYDQIYVARNDGTEELTVAPSKLKSNGDPSGTPPE